ncbi:MAG: MerR family transcriptional regulator [Pseudomonadota bacterium]
MKIGDIANRLGTTVRTLRFYEEQGLIHPRRSAGGTRLYDDQDESRFAALLALSRLDFPLQHLAELAGIRPTSETGDAASHQVAERLEAMKRQLAEQAAAIAAMQRDLEQAEALVHRCFGCRQPPRREVCDRCEVSTGVNDSQVLQVVWDEPRRA